MKQLASVVKDGRVDYFIADTDGGSVEEFATIKVPTAFGGLEAVALGCNLARAVGLNGYARGAAPREVAAQAELPPGAVEYHGYHSLARIVKDHPGLTPQQLTARIGRTPKAVASALKRAKAQGLIVSREGRYYVPAGGHAPRVAGPRRKSWKHITNEAVIDYIREHPDCGPEDVAVALLGANTTEHRGVITNRLLSIDTQATRGNGPVIMKRYEPSPVAGGRRVHYVIVPPVPVGEVPAG